MLSKFQQKIYSFFPDKPTKDQIDLVERMERFLFLNHERAAFIIRGYAGTGKTTSVAAMVKTFPSFQLKSVLLAPTGRAAKVMAKFSGKPAFTIHKKIYQSKRGTDGQTKFSLAANLHSNTIFIVDEASMISDGGGLNATHNYQSRSLLDDLIEYVYSGQNCRLIFIGDIAQLPPVGRDISPALDSKYLQREYHLSLKGVELKQVLRQAEDSGILYNATLLREQTQVKEPTILFQKKEFDDIHFIDGYELEDELDSCIGKYGTDETIVITRSNKRANEFNQQIRVRIKDLDEEVATGDYIMIVKNNYFWLDENSPIGFIANGDIAEIMRMGNIENLYGFRFLNATIRLVDYPKLEPVEAKLLLDSIMSEAPALSPEENQRLFETVLEDYADEPNRRKKYEALKNNPYFNALQIKFAYAVTCHKSQGGQWKAVFVDQGYLTDEMVNVEYARWLYTAITRATEQLYLVNFNPKFLS
ncbi:MAG: AAA family ATPase [Flavobacteriales bacterium]|nr:AAA family ATPase [Flavobacteriales bacterium]